MKNFVYLYHSNRTTPPTQEALDEFTAWFATLGDKVVDGGNPIERGSHTVIANGKARSVNDTIVGYGIVKAKNLEEAVKMAMGNPLANADGASVHVYATTEM